MDKVKKAEDGRQMKAWKAAKTTMHAGAIFRIMIGIHGRVLHARRNCGARQGILQCHKRERVELEEALVTAKKRLSLKNHAI
jgi:hypothetical protein